MVGKGRKEKAVAFIVARLSSSRFPAKHFRPIGNRPLLQWVVDNLQESEALDDIVIATVEEPENVSLKEVAQENAIACYWYQGEVDHVTNRLRTAAEAFEADICLLVSGDCPLIHAPSIDRMIRVLRERPDADTARLLKDEKGHSPALQGIVLNRKKAWQMADDLADRPELKEHQFPVIGLRPELFHPIDIQLAPSIYMPYHRLSVDTQADLDFMNALYDQLALEHKSFRLDEAVGLLKECPELKAINGHVHQRRLVEEIKKTLFIVDAGGAYGYGHLMRSMHLARQIIERLSWPVTFLVDDEQANVALEDAGHRTLWGAFARQLRDENKPFQSSIESIIAEYDLVVIDIFDQRGPDIGWRSSFNATTQFIAIENMQPWVPETDMLVIPNIINRLSVSKHQTEKPIQKQRKSPSQPHVIGGEKFIILRDEIQRLAKASLEKSLDVFVYLHDTNIANVIQQSLRSHGITVKCIQGFSEEFPIDLAKARVFISGFGVSFYEAIAVSTTPICWPDSKEHKSDALCFYRTLAMKPLIFDSLPAIEKAILYLLRNPEPLPKRFVDGTPAIVSEIEAFFSPSAS